MPCADDSRHNHENHVGTASPVECWVLITYPQPWGASAFLESNIPSLVKTHIQGIYKEVPASRIQVITQNGNESLACYLAVSQEGRQQLFRFPLESYEDILQLDWQAILNNPEAYLQHLVEDAVALICTNDSHDPCCGQYGTTLFEEAQALKNVWQTNHLGGDRFAANVVMLPQGIYYRRVSLDSLVAIQTATQNHAYFMPNMAGRSYYDRITQIAEHYLYSTQLPPIEQPTFHRWQLVTSEQASQEQSIVTFIDSQKLQYRVQLTKRSSGKAALLNCHATHAETPSVLDCKLL